MENLTYKLNGTELDLTLSGKVDSNNAPVLEKESMDLINQFSPASILFDLENLEYISSAGLRAILKIRKKVADTKLINASPAVYDIFEVTGFTEILDVQKAYRVVSIEGCQVIGEGANGKVYRIDPETIVKVYINDDALPEIHRERELARTAFISGVPTAIPYDVVKIEGGGYGSVFELLDTESYLDLLKEGQKSVDEIARMGVDLLKIIHATEIAPGTLPDMKNIAFEWVDSCQGYIPDDQLSKIRSMVEDIPYDNHMLHGDYHVQNIMYMNGESLLIDMDTICHGHPIFEFAGMYNTYVGFDEINPANAEVFLGIPYETGGELFDKTLHLYLDGMDEEAIEAIRKKAAVIGHIHIINHFVSRNKQDSGRGRALIEHSRKKIDSILPTVSDLVF
jgi:uncharacterized protein (TIGR02172 family)